MLTPDDDTVWHHFTLPSLGAGGADREQVESLLEGELDRLDRGWTYDDVLDEIDGAPWREPDGAWARVELPTSTDDPVYVRLRNIAKRVRRELEA